MMPKFLGGLTALSLVLLFGRCDSPIGPEEAAAVYVLEQINGNPVPAVAIAHDFAVTEIIADTFWIETNGTGMRRVTYHSTEATGESNTYRSEDPLTYRLNGERIEIEFACRDVILRFASVGFQSCIAPPHFVGRLESDGLLGEGLHQNQMRYRRL